MLAALQELDINLVFCGHDHNYQRLRPLTIEGSDRMPLQIVITGLAGANFYDAQEKEYTAKVINRRDHFCVVTVQPDKLSISTIAADGELLDQFSLSPNAPPAAVHEVPAP